MPVVAAFCCLTVYGLAFTWLARRRPKLITVPMRDQLWPTLWLGGALGILLGSVFARRVLDCADRLLSTALELDTIGTFGNTMKIPSPQLRAGPGAGARPPSRPAAIGAWPWPREGRFAAAIAQFQQALEIELNVAAQKNLAWLLATCPAASLRNGVEAIEHARRANRLRGRMCDILDTLAAAYA